MIDDGPIVCIGEVLWDGLPEGLFLGGAPLNVCLNLRQFNEQAYMVSRIGHDRLGREALRRIADHGIDTRYIQQDDTHETGFVKVTLDEKTDPHYEFVQPAAWDFIDVQSPEVQSLLAQAGAVVFGSLAQRSNSMFEALPHHNCLRVLDMNLRAPHYSREQIIQLVEAAHVVKMNEEELKKLQEWGSFPRDNEQALRAITEAYELTTVCVTAGSHGAFMLHKGEWHEHPGYAIDVVDTVGAGDAFLAALLHGLRAPLNPQELLAFANAAGAYVASRSGAKPNYSSADIEAMTHRIAD